MFSHQFTLSKRLLGVLMLIAGVIGFIGILAIDLVDFGREGGIGPAQRVALAGCVALALVGCTLIPLGKSPA